MNPRYFNYNLFISRLFSTLISPLLYFSHFDGIRVTTLETSYVAVELGYVWFRFSETYFHGVQSLLCVLHLSASCHHVAKASRNTLLLPLQVPFFCQAMKVHLKLYGDLSKHILGAQSWKFKESGRETRCKTGT